MISGLPMHLYHEGVPLGELHRYGYETPWASAWLIGSPATISRYASICAFFDWVETLPDDLPDAEADERYERERITRGIDAALLDAYWRGWSILLSNGERREISPPRFEPDGFATWRW